MSASSSAASSTISRSRAAVATCITITAVIGIYYLSSTFYDTNEPEDVNNSNTSLRRSNAVHRRRQSRRNTVEDQAHRVATGEDIFEDAELIDRLNSPGQTRDELSPLDLETVVDEDGDDWNDEQPPDPRSGQNVVQLLFRVSEEATKQSSYVHRGCHCDSCGTVPIRGIRYRCSNCADYDLCEACEAQQLHTKTHIFYKIRVPASTFSSRQSQPPWYPGQPDTALSQLPKPLIAKLSKETGLERQEIYAYWEQFTFMANTEWREDPDGLCLAMDRVTFDQCLVPSGGWRNVAPTLIFDRMFAFYDTNHDGLISFPEFLNGLAFRKQKDKLKKIFQGYDLDGDGYVDRKDFLRIFRSYYTMYKAIHEDLMESLDDHTISRTEAQQLISGRQPLSSAFGRDLSITGGGARDARAGEGKLAINGDLEVVDGHGVVNESGKDHGEREDVIIDAVVREHTRLGELARRNAPLNSAAIALDPSGFFGAAVDPQYLEEIPFANEDVRDAHWEAMLNPPQTIDEFQHNLLDNLISARQEHNDEARRDPAIPSDVARQLRTLGSSYEDLEIRHELLQGAFNTSNWPPEYVAEEDVVAVCGHTIPMNEVPTENRFYVIKQALKRRRRKNLEIQTSAAKRAIYERWKKRQFYTDEEEGAIQPDYYFVEDDIPEDARIPGGVDQTAADSPRPVLSPRSRSSSKVRFAEDTDDYDVRSNPSTGSRSVPERWGGMDIPEAEKDAGKEILFQVTQQAFNELLDPLFKSREDMAMNVMATKKERERYRHLFTSPDFEKWAVEVDQNTSKTSEGLPKEAYHHMEAGIREGGRSGYLSDDVDTIREQPLEELLAASGYQVMSPSPHPADEDIEDVEDDSMPSLIPNEDPAEPLLDNDPQTSESPEIEEPYIDPTLPQNRPNSLPPPPSPITPPPAPRAHFAKAFNENYVAETVAPWSSSAPQNLKTSNTTNFPNGIAADTSSSAAAAAGTKPTSSKTPSSPPPSKSRLYLLRNHDRYEQMAKGMGGWGRLDFKEFEKIVRGKGKEEKSGSGSGGEGFEYLGSWIDMCIP